MDSYLIEFRFFGKAKREAKKLIWDVNRTCRIRPSHRPVPHVTLAGPFITRNQNKLVSDFKKLCEKYSVMKYHVIGFNTFEDNRVVYIDINPNEELDEFRWELANMLRPYCYLKQYDLQRKFEFHATVAMKLTPDKFRCVNNYIEKRPKLDYKHLLLRVAIIKNSKILYEYDFILKRLLNRREAKSWTVLTQTFKAMKNCFEEGENNIKKIDYEKYVQSRIQTEEINIEQIKQGFFSKIFNIGKRKIFFISDTHFDHTNIIKYCKRPFNSTSDMNKAMLNNWNGIVKKNDIVFFLGDIAFGRDSRNADYWLSKLNGNIYFIKGNHERISRKKNVFDKLIAKYKSDQFFLVHDPKNIPEDWKGWAICGHHHNNKTREFPFIDGKKKRINVSVELINYQPLDVDRLFELDFENVGFMETIDSEPIMNH